MPAQRASEHFYHRYSISSFNQKLPGRGNWSLSHVFGFPHPWLWPCFSSLHAICCQRWAGTGHLLAVWARADITIIIAYSNYYIFQPKAHFSQLALCYCAWMKPRIVQRVEWGAHIYGFLSIWKYLRIYYKLFENWKGFLLYFFLILDKLTTEYCLINIRVKWVEIIRNNLSVPGLW